MAKAQSKETARIKISEGAKEKDALRESYLRNLGFDVLRFNNTSAAESPGWVAHTIADHLGYNKD